MSVRFVIVVVAASVLVVSAFNVHLNKLDSTDEFSGLASSTKLNVESFHRQINSSQHYFVLFYAPWCEYCLALLPHWKALSEIVAERFSRSIAVGQVDCTAEEVFCARLDVPDYPIIRAYTRGSEFETLEPHELIDTVDYLQEYGYHPPEDGSSDVV
ncbi:thioredoxin domain-containing protein 5-like [Toxorhynchites rutilus septentrionalis]|uniref:thioredoxin domain-containing protein 5-like n=1 Tax=Toxorhynchites rutilus septentrionalis TaxID=329112 RepID=UPI00247965A7|nr:thioredoxin domain-containing protein 5-like [Toxorhynchites rutilus septentrionalis]